MGELRVELAEIALPDFGQPSVEPQVGAEEYEQRLEALRDRATARGLDALVVYGDREHFANLAFLTGFDPRFEEAVLVVAGDGPPTLLVGNECWDYAENSPLSHERRLYQQFSLMGQDRSRSEALESILREAGLDAGASVGVIDWKYFGPEVGPNARYWINAPAYLVEMIGEITGGHPVNATDIMIDPAEGLRIVNTVDQLAAFEFAATHLSSAMRRAIVGLRSGMTEYQVIEGARLNGMPLSVHPVVASGPRAYLGPASPSNRRLEVGDPMLLGIGVWGALCARVGFVARDASDLPVDIRDYVDRLVGPYYSAIVEWYQTVGLGVKGAELFEIVERRLGDPWFGVSLNPGHYLHLDEWVHSPVYAGSEVALRSGTAMQVDVIPGTGGPYYSTNVEDGIALADADLRDAFAQRWPEAWSRIQARRAFMRDALGIQLKPEVLPFSNLAAHLTPFLLSPEQAMRVEGR